MLTRRGFLTGLSATAAVVPVLLPAATEAVVAEAAPRKIKVLVSDDAGSSYHHPIGFQK